MLPAFSLQQIADRWTFAPLATGLVIATAVLYLWGPKKKMTVGQGASPKTGSVRIGWPLSNPGPRSSSSRRSWSWSRASRTATW